MEFGYDKISEGTPLVTKGSIIQFSNELCGTSLKLKEIHLHTTNQSEHELTDKCVWEISSVYDHLLEGMLGITDSKLEFNSIKPIIPESADVVELLKTLKKKADSLNTYICHSEFAQLENLLDEFIDNLNKYIYLARNS